MEVLVKAFWVAYQCSVTDQNFMKLMKECCGTNSRYGKLRQNTGDFFCFHSLRV